MNLDRTSRRLSIMLGWSFALTVASFLFSEGMSQHEARGIGEAAETISERILPASEALAELRADIARLDASLEAIDDAPRAPVTASMRAELEATSASIGASWAEYSRSRALGSARALDEVSADVRALTTSIDAYTARVASTGTESASGDLDARVRPAIVRVDTAVLAFGSVHRQEALDRARDIASLRRSSRTWSLVLDGTSAGLALVCAYFVIRVVRRLWATTAAHAAELEHFAGRVAHDIRSPLATVSFALEAARRGPGRDPKIDLALERGTRTLRRVGEVVDGLLVFASAGRPFVAEDGANVGEVIDGVLEDVRPDAETKHIDVRWAPPPRDVMIACSPGVLASLMSNLVGNAIQALEGEREKAIRVEVRASRRSVVVAVEDTGPGIPPALRDRVFAPHLPAEGPGNGLGLGLPTVRRLVEAHGGTVGVRSRSAGGSVLWFELPRWFDRREERRHTPSIFHAPAPRTTSPTGW